MSAAWPDVRSPLYEIPTRAFFPNTEEWYRKTGIPTLKTTGAWSSANLAVYTPILLPRPVQITTFRMAVFNGGVVSGNFDLGVYLPDADGLPGDRATSTGSVAQSGTNVFQNNSGLGLTWLPKGLVYLACAFNNTTAEVIRLVALAADGGGAALGGIFTEAAAFPLPATATPNAAGVAVNVPILSISAGGPS